MDVRPSPFPGMDPYLGERWSDVHSALISFAKEALQPQLGPGLRARAEERLLVQEDGVKVGDYRSDVAVVSVGAGGPRPTAMPAAGAASIVVEFPRVAPIERWIEIVDTRAGNRVVTAIEVLSPANKAAGQSNADYRQKVDDYAAGGTSLVEIDLLRGTRSRLRVPWTAIRPDARGSYMTCVRRATPLERWECQPIGLRDRLPAVSVPQRSGEPDAVLELQPLVDRAYAAGGHDDLDYTVDPDPPLAADDAAWADALLRSAGRRA